MDVMTLAAKLTLNTSEFNADLSSSEKKMKQMSSGGVAWGTLLARGVEMAARAVTDFGAKTLKVGADFDTVMSSVKAVGQMEDDQFIAVRKRAMELGETTKFTAAQVGEAFYYMALAGWDTEEMLDGIGGVLNLAAASGEDLGRTSDIVTDAITAMGMEASDASRFVDVLAQASANSNTTVGQMGEAFKFLATTGGVLHYSIEDIAVTLGLLANNGIKASQAGTSMRQILNTLINPSKEAAEAMEALGISLFDPETNARKPLGQVLQEFREVFKDAGLQLEEGFDASELQSRLDALNAWYDEESAKIEQLKTGRKKAQKELDEEYAQRFSDEITPNQSFLSKLGDIGGLRGISSLFAIMNSGTDDFNELTEKVYNSTDAAQTMADTMLDNLQGDITILQSAMEGLQIIVSDKFKGQLRDFVQTLTTEIGELNEAFQQDGVLGMFTNLANWVVNGLVDALETPNEEQINSFGKAIGTFVGSLATRLVTDAGSIVSGIVTIGEGLGSGLLEGLMSGLFSDKSQVATISQRLTRELGDIEVDNVKAQGLLYYLEELLTVQGENATKTDAWKTAVEQLEAIMPGVKAILEDEGSTLEENISKVRRMTDEFRKQAIQQAMVNTLQEKYQLLAQQGVDREVANNERIAAASQQRAIIDTYLQNIARYNTLVDQYLGQGRYLDENGEIRAETDAINRGQINIGGTMYDLNTLNGDQLQGVLDTLIQRVSGMEEKDIWETNQDYLSPDEVKQLNAQYAQAGREMDAAVAKIADINSQMDATKSDIATTEKAVQSVTSELNGTAEGVGGAGSAVVGALNGVASEIAGIHFSTGEGEADGSHAKGLWSVPYDDYTAQLHRGEMVLTASQARRYREGGNDLDLSGLGDIVRDAIKAGIENATIKSYISGREVTDDVNRNTIRMLKARRFAT